MEPYHHSCIRFHGGDKEFCFTFRLTISCIAGRVIDSPLKKNNMAVKITRILKILLQNHLFGTVFYILLCVSEVNWDIFQF